jgi:hypothetical protein
MLRLIAFPLAALLLSQSEFAMADKVWLEAGGCPACEEVHQRVVALGDPMKSPAAAGSLPGELRAHQRKRMPRCFFDVADGHQLFDKSGFVCEAFRSTSLKTILSAALP